MSRITSAAIAHLKKDNSNEIAETDALLVQVTDKINAGETTLKEVETVAALAYLYAKLGRLYAAKAKELAPNESE